MPKTARIETNAITGNRGWIVAGRIDHRGDDFAGDLFAVWSGATAIVLRGGQGIAVAADRSP